jgi:hypothetical protein
MSEAFRHVIYQPCTKGIFYGVALYLTILTIVAAGQSNPTATSFFNEQVKFWAWAYSAPNTPIFVIVAIVVWVFAYLWSWPGIKKLERLDGLLDEQSVKAPPIPRSRDIAHVNSASHVKEIVSSSLNANEEPDTASLTGTVGIFGLYVGAIIVAAGALKDDLYLEIAVRGFNGSNERLVIGEIAGRIRAGIGNVADYIELPPLAVRETVRSEPYSEFTLVLHQSVSAKLSRQFLATFDKEATGIGGLDLRALTIKATCEDNLRRWTRLPLWDGVNLRRRDDIVTSRNTILSAPLLENENQVFSPTVTQTPREKSEMTDGPLARFEKLLRATFADRLPLRGPSAV